MATHHVCSQEACQACLRVLVGCTWWIDRILVEKAGQWEEEDRLPHEGEEPRKMGRRWVDLDGDQLMDVEVAGTLSESESEDDADEIKR